MKIKTSSDVVFTCKHTDKVVCGLDGEKVDHLEGHLRDEHDMSLRDYQREGRVSVSPFSGDVLQAFYSRDVERKGNKSHHDHVEIAGVRFRRKTGEPKNVPTRPDGYRYPKKGEAGRACSRVARALKYGRSIYLYGEAGTGKSDLFRAMAHDLNMEFSLYSMREDIDPALYIGKEAVVIDEESGQNKTTFIPGKLLRDIQGRVGHDGVRRPVLILLDDGDRALAETHEILRHILDNSKSVFVPEMGENVPVYPGTQVVMTANSRGRGDEFGFYDSVQTMDDSLLDRFNRFIEYHFLEADEERAILEDKFPFLKDRAPKSFKYIMNICEDLRYMIRENEVFFSFSHRRLEDWCRSVEELIREGRDQDMPVNALVGLASEDWLERYDVDTREAVLKRTLRTYLPPESKYNSTH